MDVFKYNDQMKQIINLLIVAAILLIIAMMDKPKIDQPQTNDYTPEYAPISKFTYINY